MTLLICNHRQQAVCILLELLLGGWGNMGKPLPVTAAERPASPRVSGLRSTEPVRPFDVSDRSRALTNQSRRYPFRYFRRYPFSYFPTYPFAYDAPRSYAVPWSDRSPQGTSPVPRTSVPSDAPPGALDFLPLPYGVDPLRDETIDPANRYYGPIRTPAGTPIR